MIILINVHRSLKDRSLHSQDRFYVLTKLGFILTKCKFLSLINKYCLFIGLFTYIVFKYIFPLFVQYIFNFAMETVCQKS